MATAPERSDRITSLQSIFESGQRDTNARLDKLFGYVTREIQNRDAVIIKLREVEKKYYALVEEKNKLNESYYSLCDKAKSYKLLSIVSTTLILIMTTITYLVIS